ncbi:MAG TPA: NAD(P)/FAD-dependent oxidoreductase [Candidatus Thermoplasmatota archaeon]|nr:NAD(P)/FAD-dependent oxidoreductase [Candidatus Thermoplasmatota archaeon]
MQRREADVLVIGGGPAGLHAALKAAILNHDVVLVDKGRRFSRVSQAAAVANVPGRPGASGLDLLEQGRRDIRAFERAAGRRRVRLIEESEVTRLRLAGGRFEARVAGPQGETIVLADVVVLATGMVDRKPGLRAFDARGHQTLAPFVRKERVGYCLLCEGWRLRGREVAVVGESDEAIAVARDVRDQYEGRPTLLTDGIRVDADVPVDPRPIARYDEADGRLLVRFQDGATRGFDQAIFGLGVHRVNSDLAAMVGARLTREGFVETDGNCEALAADGPGLVEGLYAIGDVRAHQWKQIVIAWGDAETAILAAYAKRLPTRADAAGYATPRADAWEDAHAGHAPHGDAPSS